MTDNTNETPLADSFEKWLELNPETVSTGQPPTENQIAHARFFGFDPDALKWETEKDGYSNAQIAGELVFFSLRDEPSASILGHYEYFDINTRERFRDAMKRAVEATRKANRPKVIEVCNHFGQVLELVNDGYFIQHVVSNPSGDGSVGTVYYILALPDALPPRE